MHAFEFGGVYAICYTGKPDRHAALMAELRRVGLTAEVVWDFPTQYKNLIADNIPHEGIIGANPGVWGATLRHYEAIKIAYERGQDRVLFLEDDCRFLADVDAVNRGLLAAPADWDILMLDHFDVSGRQQPPVNGWARTSVSRSVACYVVRRKAMERLIDMYESPVSGKYPHPMMRTADHWIDVGLLGRDIAIYNAVPNLAVQQDCGDRSNYGHTPEGQYGSLGIDLSQYAPYGTASCAGHGQSLRVGAECAGGAAGTVQGIQADVWSRFDFRAACCFSGYFDRAEPLRAEFKRVGLADVVEFWSAPNPFLPLLNRSLRLCGMCASKPYLVALTLKHQQMIRAAYDTGANFGLFMEDDIMFLRDTALLQESLKHVPADADALLFEWIAPWGPKEFHERIKARESGDYWYRFGRTGVLNCGCYALSRKAMAVMLRVLEGPADGQALFDVCDRHWPVLSDESGLNIYVSSPVACIQNEAKHRHAYEAVGARRELYGA